MLLVEILGLEQFRQRVQIYGTDVDQYAILQAQKGWYSTLAAGWLSAAWQSRELGASVSILTVYAYRTSTSQDLYQGARGLLVGLIALNDLLQPIQINLLPLGE